VTGTQVVELREALDMSRLEMSHALNVTPSTLAHWEKDGPHTLGMAVLLGLHSAVFNPKDEGAERSSRILRIAGQLRLGLGALLFMQMMDVVSRPDVARRSL